jgi:alpha-L-arabinofuranosidase
MRFVRAVGAEPYFAANIRSLTPKDFYEWVDYCNAPAGKTTLAGSPRRARSNRNPAPPICRAGCTAAGPHR